MTAVKPILLAEDNPRDAELALAAMEEQHISDKVVLCHDGAEVLDYLYCRGLFKSRLKGNPAVVFLDLKMPGKSGLELVKALREIDPATKTVVLTGYGSIATAIDAVRLGATYYLSKPADADDIVACRCVDRHGQATWAPRRAAPMTFSVSQISASTSSYDDMPEPR